MTFKQDILPKLIEYCNEDFDLFKFETNYMLTDPYDESGNYYFYSNEKEIYEFRNKLKGTYEVLKIFKNETELWEHWAQNKYKYVFGEHSYKRKEVDKVAKWILEITRGDKDE